MGHIDIVRSAGEDIEQKQQCVAQQRGYGDRAQCRPYVEPKCSCCDHWRTHMVPPWMPNTAFLSTESLDLVCAHPTPLLPWLSRGQCPLLGRTICPVLPFSVVDNSGPHFLTA